MPNNCIHKIEDLWKEYGFKPDDFQRQAIMHGDGPLLITAGPGSGKTTVLLWRVVQLVVYQGVSPDDIMLTTFTEKAAHQLKEGIRAMLGGIANKTGINYDTSRMFVGTVHSNCHRLLRHRELAADNSRPKVPALIDQLDQYLFVYRSLKDIIAASGMSGTEKEKHTAIIQYLKNKNSDSSHRTVDALIEFFNRMSEEPIEPEPIIKHTKDETEKHLFQMYARYKELLAGLGQNGTVDLSLLQDASYQLLRKSPNGGKLFKHIIVDEYQDTNAIQEKIFFRLAEGAKNLCVVGDDDQALYRFRGATVENLVDFPARCKKQLGMSPARVNLKYNRRSLSPVTKAFTSFIEAHDWRNGRKGSFRIEDKGIEPKRTDKNPAVVASSPAAPRVVYPEVAKMVKQLISNKVVADPNQIAFLFPSLSATSVTGLREALEEQGLSVYAPRAGSFLDVSEAKEIFGLLLHLFGHEEDVQGSRGTMKEYAQWVVDAKKCAEELLRGDPALNEFVLDLRAELDQCCEDFNLLLAACKELELDEKSPFLPEHGEMIAGKTGISQETGRYLRSRYLASALRDRIKAGRPYTVRQVINRTIGPDWNLLDLFYRFCGFKHFRKYFAAAEGGTDEGPVCNLSLISQYLARFHENYGPTLKPSDIAGKWFELRFFKTYIYALHRLGEGEYEDSEDPIPKGRIPFLTIHQAKGLEFPVVILGSLRKNAWPISQSQVIARKYGRPDGEPVDRIPEFDVTRMFYVALSRAMNLLVLCDYRGQGQTRRPEFEALLSSKTKRIPDLDINTVSDYTKSSEDVPASYSFTGDYLSYKVCPRQYMLYNRYGFAPSRMQTMMFGSLVHRTVEDLHQLLIRQREVAQ